MQIFLCSVKHSLTKAWPKFFSDLPNVTVHEGPILDLEVDAVVSPANSFGFMDGGVEALYTQHFGRQLESKLKTVIAEKHAGEIPVGNAERVETDDQ